MENKEINSNVILSEQNFVHNERRALSKHDFAQNEHSVLAQNGHYTLTERDFYPPSDNRLHHLGIEDIPGGDTYDEYLKEFWELYEDELY